MKNITPTSTIALLQVITVFAGTIAGYIICKMTGYPSESSGFSIS